MKKQESILIKAKHLKDVQKDFSKIRQRNIIPVLNFLKIEASGGQAKITKTNLESFLIHKIPAEGSGCVLIQESVLWEVVGASSPDDAISLSWDDKNYFVKRGKLERPRQIENVKQFPVVAEPDDETGVTVNIGDIHHLSSLIKEDEIETNSCFVFVGNGKAVGADGFVGHCVDFADDVEMVLRKYVLSSLPPVEMQFKTSKSYDFFVTEDFTYGFSKAEMKFSDVTKFFKIKEDSKGFTFNKKDLLKFVDMSVSSFSYKLATVSMTVKDQKMLLTGTDGFLETPDTDSIDVKSEINTTEAMFVAEQLGRLLKAVKYDEITMIPSERMYFIKFPDDSVGLIMKIDPLAKK